MKYKCKYCSCVFLKEESKNNHEFKCNHNPIHKNCFSCKHFISYSENKSSDCNKGKYDYFWEHKDYCPEWEA